MAMARKKKPKKNLNNKTVGWVVGDQPIPFSSISLSQSSLPQFGKWYFERLYTLRDGIWKSKEVRLWDSMDYIGTPLRL